MRVLYFDIHIVDGTSNGIDVILKTDKFESPSSDRLTMEEVIEEAINQGVIPKEAADCIDEINEVPQQSYESGNKKLELPEAYNEWNI